MKSFELARSSETKKIKAEHAAIVKEERKKKQNKSQKQEAPSSKKPPPTATSVAKMTVDVSVSGDNNDGAKSSISASVTHQASSNTVSSPATTTMIQQCKDDVSSSFANKANLEQALRSFDKALQDNQFVYHDLVECVSSLELTAAMAKSKLEQSYNRFFESDDENEFEG